MGLQGPTGPAGPSATGTLTVTLNDGVSSATLPSLGLYLIGYFANGWSVVSDDGYTARVGPRTGASSGATLKQISLSYQSNNCTGTAYGTAIEVARGEVVANGSSSAYYAPRNATLSSLNFNSYRDSLGTCIPAAFSYNGVYALNTNSAATTGVSLTPARDYELLFTP